MTPPLARRDLVRAGALLAAGAAAGAAARVAGAVEPPRPLPLPGAAPLFKISLAQWSLHRLLRAGKLDNLDFPRAANQLGFDAVEYVNQFFKDKAKDARYLADLKRRAAGEGIWSS